MKFSIYFLALTICCVSAFELKEEWDNFKRFHKKSYLSSVEELKRYNIWKSNSEYISNHNQQADNGVHTFWLKMNQFGDLTNSEFVSIYNGYNQSLVQSSARSNMVFEYDSNLQVPDSIDWRDQGYVTPIKDQGQCGSCWAFSTTGSLEGQHFKSSGKLVSLSEQNLVDCSTKYGNHGCNGGLMDQAFKYIKENKGIDTEDSYPYIARDQQCKFKPENVGATDSGFVDIKAKDENALLQAVGTVGPVSVAIDASHSSFQFYSKGIYHEPMCSSTRLDHGVLAVGYGKDSNQDYWLVKNSWSTAWGDSGYIKMERNKKNACGIATSASYPTV